MEPLERSLWLLCNSETHESLNTNEYFFEHELNELNEFFIKTCDSKIIRVIRIIRVQKKLRYVVYIFEHELNEFFIKTCDSKIINCKICIYKVLARLVEVATAVCNAGNIRHDKSVAPV